MRIVVFGLTVSSSWGNGHATLWRGMIGALTRLGHRVVFFERDVPYYRDTRDATRLGGGAELVLYPDWAEVRARAEAEVAAADVAMVTSFCPDGPTASELAFESAPGLTVFYDMDTPVTLARLADGRRVEYLPAGGLGNFDLVLSYTGGAALDLLRTRLGARRVAPLYGHVDPEAHRPGQPLDAFRGDLCYLGTYAEDRQPALQRLLVEPARLRPDIRFVMAGAGYPHDFPWSDNIFFVRHLPPPEHPAFFASSRLTLNVTRGAMAAMGWCPSGRLFEAAACGVPVLTDTWNGLEDFFTPGEQILTAERAEDVVAALELPPGELAGIARAARTRVCEEHSSGVRAGQLLALLGAGGTALGEVAPGTGRADVTCGE
jgi:spore maturation protein CgeB